MSTRKKSSLNFLALLPPKDLSEEIKTLKQEIAQKYNCTRALRLPAHITMVPPFKPENENLKGLKDQLEDFCRKFSEMTIMLRGFGAFPPRVLFIEVSNPEEIRPFRDQLLTTLQSFLSAETLNTGRPFRPHITLATRDLSRDSFYPAWEDLKNRNFNAWFNVAELTLFQHNGKTWDLKSSFKFQKREI